MTTIRRKFPWSLFPMRKYSPNFKKLQKDRIKYAPRRLPERRPRALSCPPPATSNQLWNRFKKPQQTFNQDQSLFSRLPPEIRRLIWIKVLGGRLLHIARVTKRLLAVDCVGDFGPDLYTRHHGCWSVTPMHINNPTPGCFYGSGPRDKQESLLPLLQTCRRIYIETIPILYEENIFDINHLDTVLYLRQSVLPQRLNQIRVLNFTWCFRWDPATTPAPWDFATWRETCNILAGFSGLQELTMHLDGSYLEESELETLRPINPAKKFDVRLPWSEDKCGQTEQEKGYYPFRLISEAEPPFGHLCTSSNPTNIMIDVGPGGYII